MVPEPPRTSPDPAERHRTGRESVSIAMPTVLETLRLTGGRSSCTQRVVVDVLEAGARSNPGRQHPGRSRPRRRDTPTCRSSTPGTASIDSPRRPNGRFHRDSGLVTPERQTVPRYHLAAGTRLARLSPRIRVSRRGSSVRRQSLSVCAAPLRVLWPCRRPTGQPRRPQMCHTLRPHDAPLRTTDLRTSGGETT